MTDNAALIAIVEQLEQLNSFFTGSYDAIAGDSDWRAVTTTLSLARAADPLAIKTVVSNRGASAIAVYEDTKLVCVVPDGESRELPLSGTGEIKWKCVIGSNADAALATYRNTV